MKSLVRTNGLMSPAISSLLNDFFADRWADHQPTDAGMKRISIPPANIRETNDAFQIEVAAPGLVRELFKIEYDNDLLTVSYVPKEEGVVEPATYVLREFAYHAFERSFMLPKQKVESEKIEARYTDGILVLTVPKKEDQKRKPVRQITIS